LILELQVIYDLNLYHTKFVKSKLFLCSE